VAAPDAVLRWLDRLGDLDLDGTGVVLEDGAAGVPVDGLAGLTDHVTVDGCLVRVVVYLSRDYMPGGLSGDHPVKAIVRMTAVEAPALPPGLDAERVVVVSPGGEVWTAPLVDGTWDYGGAMAQRIARHGPTPTGPSPWDTGTTTDVLVRLRDATGGRHVLGLPSIQIFRSA
jgi:hypothetical protein